MSSISEWYNATAEIYRSITSGGSKRPADTLVDTIGCVFRPITAVTKLYSEANLGREFDLWCETTSDIKIGDVVVIDTKRYGVLGVQEFQDLEGGIETHLQVRITYR